MFGTPSPIEQRIEKLKAHLERENPVLLDVVKGFRRLDKVAYSLGMLSREESFATRVPWWPMIAVLGTFSSGKSTFINSYIGERLQLTGNQAVDDKFTVICFSADESQRTLPGLALDADPRFPFYQMSRDIDAVADGDAQHVDAFLQLKPCHSDALRGKILIDSPGFDADAQRTATLKITDHIIDLSDLVLVFFDARHPEPGAMQDTLEHLVACTVKRADSNKFLYILNQIDNAAREDNPEEVFAAWQRALAQKGLTAGRFYSIYSQEAAIPIDDPKLRQRFEAKRDADATAILQRIDQVEVERAYRIIGVLEQTAKSIERRVVPMLRTARARWRRRVMWLDAVVFGALAAAFATWSIGAGHWDGLAYVAPWFEHVRESALFAWLVAVAGVAVAGWIHFSMRSLAARTVLAGLRRDSSLGDAREGAMRAFEHNVRPWHTVLASEPIGWTRFTQRRVARVLADADGYVQTLNNRFADPSGSRSKPAPAAAPAPAPVPAAPAPSDPGASQETAPISSAGER